jgi:hypothetical protein
VQPKSFAPLSQEPKFVPIDGEGGPADLEIVAPRHNDLSDLLSSEVGDNESPFAAAKAYYELASRRTRLDRGFRLSRVRGATPA